jgi:drug/metabolite transporter (DMT)-like permease
MPNSVNQSRQRLALLLIFVAPAFWTVNYLVARWAPGYVAPHVLALGRWTMALVLMGVWLYRPMRANALEFKAAIRRERWQLLVLGALGMWVCGAFVYQGGRNTQAINIALIYAISPVLIALISTKLMHEQQSRLQQFGFLLGIAGALVVVGKGSLQSFLSMQMNMGDWWIIVAATCWAVYSVLLKYWVSDLPPAVRLAAITAGGVIVLIPFTIIESQLWTIDTWISWRGLGLMALAAVFPGFLAYQSHSFIMKELGAAQSAVLLYLSPVYAAIAAWLALGEPLRWYHLLGAGLVLPGVYLSSRTATKPMSDPKATREK